MQRYNHFFEKQEKNEKSLLFFTFFVNLYFIRKKIFDFFHFFFELSRKNFSKNIYIVKVMEDNKLMLPIGIQRFEEIRKGGYIFDINGSRQIQSTGCRSDR